MDVQICSQCNWPMENSHYQVCWTCWRENQGYKRIKSDDRYDELQKVIHQLLEETPDTSQLESHIKALQSQVHQLKLEVSQLRYEQSNAKIDQGLIKKLLMFCHPDRNQDRKEVADEITKILLSLREK